MAQLTSADYQKIRKIIRNDPTLRPEFKGWTLDKPTWYAVFQAVEDWFVNAFATTPTQSFRDQVEAVAGATGSQQVRNARAQAVGRAWIKWRFTQ